MDVFLFFVNIEKYPGVSASCYVFFRCFIPEILEQYRLLFEKGEILLMYFTMGSTLF